MAVCLRQVPPPPGITAIALRPASERPDFREFGCAFPGFWGGNPVSWPVANNKSEQPRQIQLFGAESLWQTINHSDPHPCFQRLQDPLGSGEVLGVSPSRPRLRNLGVVAAPLGRNPFFFRMGFTGEPFF